MVETLTNTIVFVINLGLQILRIQHLLHTVNTMTTIVQCMCRPITESSNPWTGVVCCVVVVVAAANLKVVQQGSHYEARSGSPRVVPHQSTRGAFSTTAATKMLLNAGFTKSVLASQCARFFKDIETDAAHKVVVALT